MSPEAAAVIARFGLAPLPHEGGFFARTWTSRETLPDGRPVGTAIYFLLTPRDFSALHRVDADELWHFHAGDPVEHVQFPAGHARAGATTIKTEACVTRLGVDFTADEFPQLLVPAGAWQGARLAPSGTRGWALAGCTMSPGWREEGFVLGARAELHSRFPNDAAWIDALTR